MRLIDADALKKAFDFDKDDKIGIRRDSKAPEILRSMRGKDG